jgi:ubiquinone/menaquinone biosynthesis C-methylase UbiE
MMMSERLNKRLSSTRARCLELRNRVYPVHEWPHERYRKTVSEFGGPDRTLLEVGCGRDASDLQGLKDAYGRLIGLDLEINSPVPCERCVAFVGDAHRLPVASGIVDCVCMADVVEHLSDPVAAFRECARVLKPNGHLVISTVNVRFPPIFVAQALPHGVRQRLNWVLSGTPPDDMFPAVYLANTAKSLREAAGRAGFETVTLEHVSHHPRYLMFSYLVYRAGVAVEQVVRRRDALKGVRHFLQGVFRRA